MTRVVLDTNVTISAFFWKGHPRNILDLARAGKIYDIQILKPKDFLVKEGHLTEG